MSASISDFPAKFKPFNPSVGVWKPICILPAKSSLAFRTCARVKSACGRSRRAARPTRVPPDQRKPSRAPPSAPALRLWRCCAKGTNVQHGLSPLERGSAAPAARGYDTNRGLRGGWRKSEVWAKPFVSPKSTPKPARCRRQRTRRSCRPVRKRAKAFRPHPAAPSTTWASPWRSRAASARFSP